MEPLGGNKLDTQYDISTYYTDKELTFSGVTQGTISDYHNMWQDWNHNLHQQQIQ